MNSRFSWDHLVSKRFKIAWSSNHSQKIKRPGQRSRFRPLALGQLTFVLFLIFLIPGLVMAAVYRQDEEISEQDLLNEQTRELDLYIANSVQSPFYLSRFDPCSPVTTSLLTFKNNISFDIQQNFYTDSECQWVYDAGIIESDIGHAIVIDEWKFERDTWFISRRQYRWDGILVVTDRFNPIDSNCFKKREYRQIAVEGVCLSESGILGGLRSPIPPSFYWFFYR